MQATRYLSRSIAYSLRIATVVSQASMVLNGQSGTAQTAISRESIIAAEPASPPLASLIPQQIRYSGMVPERSEDTVEAVFRIYAAPEGGEPLWTETQRVTIAPDGHYSVLLGSASSSGLPQTVFTAGQARWLGVSIDRAEELPRTLLASVAYAMKAADAETLAGQQAADFVTQEQLSATARSLATQAAALAIPSLASLAGSGTADYLPLWTGSSALSDSILYQAGTEKVGIATKTPATTLDVNGTSTLRGTVNLPPVDPATSKSAFNSPMLELGASAFSSNAKAAVAQNFAWKAVATGNDTAAASADLELLFGSGAALPAATGLAISSKGIVTFARGQAFPGTGTITGVAAGTALTGGGVSGPVTLSVDTTKVVTAVNAGAGLTGGGKGGVQTLYVDATKVPLLASANTFTGINKFSSPITFATGQTFPAPATGPGSGTITGVTAGTALTGGGVSGPVTLSVDTTKVPLLAAANTFTGANTFSSPIAGGLGIGGSGTPAGVTASSYNFGVLGLGGNVGSPDVYFGVGVAGIGPSGVYGSGACCSGGLYDSYGVWGNGQMGVFGQSLAPDSSVVGWGVSGAVSHNYGDIYSDEGVAFAQSSSAGVWGDFLNGGAGSGVLATADSNTALIAVNNSGYPTMEVNNYTKGATSPIFETSAPNAASSDHCTINTSADLTCSGTVSETVPLKAGKVVAMYAMHAPENWFEDFGSGVLQNGVAHISLEAMFGEAVNSGMEYHVFLTPKGECEGLYLANEGAEGFEVRELHHGNSSVGFDYRIVAKRKGFEMVRMEDLTPQAEARKARLEDRARRMAEAAAHRDTGPTRRILPSRPHAPPSSTPQRPLPHPGPSSPDTRADNEAH